MQSGGLSGKPVGIVVKDREKEGCCTKLFGAITYSSIFITCIVRTVKYWKSKSMLLAFGASVIAYMGHNFFCFQQVVCTSLIFIVIAMAEGDIVKLKKDR